VRVWIVPAAAIALLLACKKEPAKAPESVPSPSPSAARLASDPFVMADLVAATELDVRIARQNRLASEYKMALTFDRGRALSEHTDRLTPLLDAASAELDKSFGALTHPLDRQAASPVVESMRKWPALLRDARAELLGSPKLQSAQAAEALAGADDQIESALQQYRKTRESWKIADAPQEGPEVIAFLSERRALERLEAEMSARLVAGDAQGGSSTDKSVASAVARAREAADKVDPARRAAALRLVEAQGRALQALEELVSPGVGDERRGQLTLLYQGAKVDSSRAVADYTALTAKRVEH
jgi:hypothetical protein